ncbi:M1 family metallopeptidase [Geodermatophilus sabuli]|uniref:M1 family metallopeptidase n=1 Tax=Geodermatophilus sabuli TaxID=1564158 RepID=A0A7K3VZV2_9ACTN|nr:M1 family metallopeptidase [Geodermatophilus sabuli]NEK58169.1 M1 family metallopeptidase [Geodermatophilus sabuli]
MAATALLLLAGCGTSFVDTLAAEDAADPSPAPEAAPVEGCDQRAEPDPDRPVVALDFRLDGDLRTVTGTETVVFTPDVATGELVFRLVPNSPEAADVGNRLVVDAVRGDDVAEGGYVEAGAEEPGGLYVVRLDADLAPGESTEVELDFTLTLGSGSFERVGADENVSWWASGAPLLAWEPGVGWARDPFVEVLGETASSPVADTRITVSAPAELTVLMTGDQDAPSAARAGRRTWSSTEPVARDVSVAVGRFTTSTVTTPGGAEVTTGVLPDADVGADELADWTVTAIGDLERRFGPFPYRTLTVPLLPDYGGGIEYPSSILMAGASPLVLLHEVAHMYFYGMVGDSQFRDPWLDEAFATYAESVTFPVAPGDLRRTLEIPGDVGAAMDEFRGTEDYFARVYGKGGAALVAARDAAGAEAFDAAIRCYVDANAWTIATPDDVARALAGLPAALDVLTAAGALDEDDLPD